MYLAIREMKYAKARYALIAAIMVLVAFLVLFVTGLAQGLAYDNAASVKNMAATHFIVEQDSNHRFTRSQVDRSQLQKAAAIAGDENAEPLGVKMTTVIPSGDTAKMDVTFFAVRPEGWLAPDVTGGASLSDGNRGQVLADEKLADDGVKIGTVLVDQTSGTPWTVIGFVKNESFSHTPALFVNEREWSDLQAGAGYNAIAIKGTKETAGKLQAALSRTEVITKAEAVSAIPGYKEEQGSLLMMVVFLFVISAFILAVFFYVITIQKTGQFGILKAIGTRTAYLAGSVASQVLVLSVGSLVVSILLVRLFQAMLPSSMPFQLGVSVLSYTCLSFMAMSLAGSLVSVWKVAKIDALDAIGRNSA